MYRNLWDPELLIIRMDLLSTSYTQAGDVRKATVRWNISENRAIFCRHANHKQCFKAKKNSKSRLIALKRFHGTIIGGRGPQWLED